MSDYLSNIVGRSLGSVKGIRPRMRSMFEPPPATSASESFQTDQSVSPPLFSTLLPSPVESAGVVERPEGMPPVPMIEVPTRPAAPVVDRPRLPKTHVDASVQAEAPSASEASHRSVPEGPSLSPVQTEARPWPTPGEAEPEPPGERDRRPPLVVRRARRAGAKPVSAAPPSRLTAAPPRMQPAAVPEPLPPFSDVRGEPMPRVVEPDRTAASGVEVITEASVRPRSERLRQEAGAPPGRPQEPVAPAPMLRPRTGPALPLEAQGRTRSTSSSTAPVIRVTIGRVEVRAVHPPAPTSKKQRSRPPTLNLDDYLGQRASRGKP